MSEVPPFPVAAPRAPRGAASTQTAYTLVKQVETQTVHCSKDNVAQTVQRPRDNVASVSTQCNIVDPRDVARMEMLLAAVRERDAKIEQLYSGGNGVNVVPLVSQCPPPSCPVGCTEGSSLVWTLGSRPSCSAPLLPFGAYGRIESDGSADGIR